MTTYPLSFCHSSGVLMGDAFIQGLRYRLPLPVFCRTYSAPFCCDFSPLRSYWIRFSYLKLAYKLLDYIQQSGTHRDDAYHSLCVCVDDVSLVFKHQSISEGIYDDGLIPCHLLGKYLLRQVVEHIPLDSPLYRPRAKLGVEAHVG